VLPHTPLVGRDGRLDSLRTQPPPDALSGFTNGFPFLLLPEASLDDLNARLDSPLSVNRFRPNIVVAGSVPHEEDRCRRVRVGDVGFRVVKPCARCAITTVGQKSGEKGKEPLRTLASYRKVGGKVFFGQERHPRRDRPPAHRRRRRDRLLGLRPDLRVTLERLDGALHAVFGSYLLPQRTGALPHPGVAGGPPDGVGEPLRGELRARGRAWPRA
jgi:hypothetical protein